LNHRFAKEGRAGGDKISYYYTLFKAENGDFAISSVFDD
jgi:hypothetical protein